MLAIQSYLGAPKLARTHKRPPRKTVKAAKSFQLRPTVGANGDASQNIVLLSPPEDPNVDHNPMGSLGDAQRLSDAALKKLISQLSQFSYKGKELGTFTSSIEKGPALTSAGDISNNMGMFVDAVVRGDEPTLAPAMLFAKVTQVNAFLEDPQADLQLIMAGTAQSRLSYRSMADLGSEWVIVGYTEFPAIHVSSVIQFSYFDWQLRLAVMLKVLEMQAKQAGIKYEIDPPTYGDPGSNVLTNKWPDGDKSDPTERAFHTFLKATNIFDTYYDDNVSAKDANALAYNTLIDYSQTLLTPGSKAQALIDTINTKKTVTPTSTASASGDGNMLPIALAAAAAIGIGYAIWKPAGKPAMK